MGVLIPILLGGLALYAVSRKKVTGVGRIGLVDKQAQLDLILSTNPADDENLSYHTWIRTIDDILTYREAIELEGLDNYTPDYTAQMAKEALRTGYIKVYSSHKIEPGVFVSPSKMEAENYGTPVHYQYISTKDVAWIDPYEGMYAPVSGFGIGKLTDAPLDLDNILMGVSRGWYTARTEELAGWGYVVWLTGQKADGEPVEDVYPISKQTYEALKAQGIGAAKRRIYHELATAQKRGVDFNRSYSENNDSDLESLATKYGYKNNPNSSRSYGEQYFNNLKRAYNAIAATDLPYNESVVYNDHGDEIMRYRDYGTDEQRLQNAINDLTDDYSESGIYWRVIGMIANRQVKLLWTVPGYDKLKGYKGLQDELYGRPAPEERKLYKAVLATAANGGITPAKFVHQIWESLPPESRLDDMQIRNIVLDALRDVQTPKQARAAILSNYYDTHTLPDQPDIEYFADDPEQQRLFEEFAGDDEIPF